MGVLSHRTELIAVAVSVAAVVHRFCGEHYLLGDQDVLAGARRVLNAVAQEELERAGLPVWDQVRLSERCRAAVDRLAELVTTAP